VLRIACLLKFLPETQTFLSLGSSSNDRYSDS
jgi:hypothetical protein